MDPRTALRDDAMNPRTHRWPRSRKLGFGVLAILPGLLLFATVVAALGEALVGGPIGAVAMLAYTHVVSQLIVLVLYAHLLTANRHLHGPGITAWVAFFLLLAPVAVPLYWYLHVWQSQRRSHVDVVDLDRFGPKPA